MSAFSLRLSRAHFFLVTLILAYSTPTGTSRALTQGRASIAEEIPACDFISRAKSFIQEIYPELHHHLVAQITDMDEWGHEGVIDRFFLAVGNFPPGGGGAQAPSMKEVIRCEFTFSKSSDKSLWFFSTIPPSTGPSAAFAKLVLLHPKWTDEHVTRFLREAGATYGPEDKEKFLNAIPRGALKPLIGELTVDKAEFGVVRPNPANGLHYFEGEPICYWVVAVTTRLPDGAEKHYSLLFDAFGGKLYNISWTGR